MLSLDGTQLVIVASSYKKVSWLFKVIDSAGPTTYYWSTITRSYGGNDYVYKINPKTFKNITLNRAKSETGIQAPSDLSFTVLNVDFVLTGSNFVNGSVTVYLVVSDGTDEETIATWKFNIKRCEPVYETLQFTCEDLIQQYLEGDYPNTKLVKDVSLSDDLNINDNICVPVPFGTCYIPLRSIYITDRRYYLLGPLNGFTYTISKVRSPRSHGARSEWDTGDYAFNQSTENIDGVDWRVFQAIIADSDGDDVADANGLWKGSGDHFLDMPTQFYRHDRHNKVLWSEQFDNAAWGKTRSTVTANDTTAPDGTVTADKLELDGSDNQNHYIKQEIAKESFTNDADVTFSVYIKADEVDWINLAVVDKANVSHYVYLDLTNGVPGTVFGATASISLAENGFYRCSITLDIGNGATDPVFYIQLAEGDTDPNFAQPPWAAGDGIHIWGAQVEEFSTTKHYIQTTSAAITAGITCPAEVIQYVLEDMGVSSGDIDIGAGSSFSAAQETYLNWGLVFNGAFYYKQPREKVLATLLNMCHSTLRITDKIELHVLSKTSKKTVTKADVLKTSEVGPGTFEYSLITQKQSDSGYIAFQEVDEAQDEFIKALVTAKATTDEISGDVVFIPFVQDSQDAQRIGTLKYQREFLKGANASFKNKVGTLLAVQPDDVITINHADYGGNYAVLVDSMVIEKDLAINFACVQFSVALDNWGDLNPGAITLLSDDSGTYWIPVISGPTGGASKGYIPCVVPGCLIVGVPPNYILIDPGNIKIQSSNYISGAAGQGFFLSRYLLEVGNIACRGLFRTAVFETDSVSVVGGSLMVRPGDVLATDMTTLDASTLEIEGNETLSVNDVLRIKDDSDDEWMLVTNVGAAPVYTVTRDQAAQYAADTNPTWKKGASVVNYGASGDGAVYMTASEANAPYISVFTHAGSPWTTITTHARIGNLNGAFGFGADTYGFAFGDSTLTNSYIKYDSISGLMVIKGSIAIESMYNLPSDISLAGHWRFDDGEGTTIVDGSGNARHGVASGALWAIANSKEYYSGDALWFDGDNDKVDLISSISLTGAFSISFWGYVDSFADDPGIGGNQDTFDPGGTIAFDGAGDTFFFGTSTGNKWQVMTTEAFPSGAWFHMVFIRDGSNNLHIYKNGEDITDGTITQGGTITWNRIGDLPDNSDWKAWDGSLDEFRIYNGYVLTDSEVKALYLYPTGNKSTIISGRDIKTGAVSSLDWAAAAGVQFQLDDRWIKMGGSNVTAAGAAAGIFLGLDTSYKFYVGDGSNKYIKFDGTDITIGVEVSFGINDATWQNDGIQLQYNAGNPRLYCGDGANDYFQFDGTNVTISTSVANAIIIKSGADISIEAGGDIVMTPDDANPSIIKFSTAYNIGAAATASIGLCFWPTNYGTNYFRVGWEPTADAFWPFANIILTADDAIILQCYEVGGNVAQFYCSKISSTRMETHSRLSVGGTTKDVRTVYDTGASLQYFGPDEDKEWNLARAAQAWDDAYADDWNNVADFFHLDRKDDLGAINAIKGSGLIDKRTGLELINDNTIPEWMLVKDKASGAIARDSDNKPYLSMKMCDSLSWGAIRQLDDKIIALTKKINQLTATSI